MRVLFLAKSFGVIGGAERWLDLLVAGLRGRSFECLVALANGQHHDAAAYAGAHPDLPAVFLENPSGAPSGRLWAARAALRKFAPDVAVPLMLYDGLAAAALEKERLGHRVVYSLHGSRAGALQDVRQFARVLDAVVAVDGFTRRVLVEKELAPSERIHLIPCGVPEAKRRTELFRTRALRVGFCGRLEQMDKRALDLVPLARELARRQIVFDLSVAGAGSCEEELKRGLQEVLNDHGRLTWHGAHEPDWLYEHFYPELDLLVVTSESEAGPLVALEAMLHGCAVVSSDFLGREEGGLLKADRTALVFPVADMRRAAERVQALVRDPARARALANAGREHAELRTATVMVDEWSALLGAVTGVVPVHGEFSAAMLGDYRRASRLERAGLGPGAADLLRMVLGRRFRHATPSSEWPFHAKPDPDLEAVYEGRGARGVP